MPESGQNIDAEIMEAWERFVRILLGIVMLTGAALIALYFDR